MGFVIWAASVVGLWSVAPDSIRGMLQALFFSFVAWVGNFIKFAFDPVVLMETGFRLLGKLMLLVVDVVPEGSRGHVAAAADFMNEVPIREGVAGALWFLRPVVSVELMLALFAAMAYIILICYVLRAAFFIKTLVYPTGN